MTLRVIVAGCGIGGLSTAVAASRLGLQPIVLEQAGALREVGAGLNFAPNAGRVAEHLGVGDHVRRLGVFPERMTYLGLEDGRVLQTVDLRGFGESPPYCSIHRADLLEGLLSQLPDGHVRVGSRVVGFEETPDEVRVELANGEVVRGDVLIGSDGLNSVIRQQLFGQQEAVFTGLAAWRGTVDYVESLRVTPEPELRYAKGKQTALLTYPVRAGQLLNFVAVVFAADERPGSWSLRGEPEDLRLAFADGCDEVKSVIEAVEETFVTGFYDRPPLPSWGTARVALLGDAAHPTSPSTGSGAAMALEDAVTVAHCLARNTDDVAAGLAEYSARRRPRTTKFLVQARHNNAEQFEAERNPSYRAAFDRKFKGINRLDPDGDSVNWARSGWLWRFDAVAALELPSEATYPPGWEVPNRLTRGVARRAFEMWRQVLSFDDMPTWLGQRAAYDRFLLQGFPAPTNLAVDEVDCAGVPGLFVRPAGTDRDGPIVLHLHGGGFVMGSARSSVELAGRLANAVAGSALVVDYRLAPENGFPAALDDALAAYRWLAERGVDQIVVTGEDAGGGLAVSLACALRDSGESLPRAIFAVSPFCDMALSSSSITSAADPWHNRDSLTHLSASYIQGEEPGDPRLSPIYADLTGLPPLLVYVAEGEALADDARSLAAAAERDGVDVTLAVVADSVHSFLLFDFLPETNSALDALTELVHDRTHH